MIENGTTVTPHEVVISSQSLLRLSGDIFRNSKDWGLDELTDQAKILGVRLIYEPLRKRLLGMPFSKATNDIESAHPEDPRLKQIAYLAEQAKSEAKMSDYFTSRIVLQLLYFLLEEGRFAQSTMNRTAAIEQKIAYANNQLSVPIRVYPDRRNDGVKDALIFDSRLRTKIYAQSQYQIIDQELQTMNANMSTKDKAIQIVKAIEDDIKPYNLSGIELSLLALTTKLGNDQELLDLVTAGLVAARNYNDPRYALVQAISVQPNRADFPDRHPYSVMERTIKAAAQQSFKGTVIYSPGGGDVKTEIDRLKSSFSTSS